MAPTDTMAMSGRTAVITGTGGLGLEDAFALAQAGAHVIIAGRNPAKGKAARAGGWLVSLCIPAFREPI